MIDSLRVKRFALLAVLCFLSVRALAQGGCTVYKTWDQTGFAGTAAEGPGGDPGWQQGLANSQAQNGGIGPSCKYTWIVDDPNSGLGHWYGDCYSVGYSCPAAPDPPPNAAPETAPSVTCPNCGAPISLADGNTYIKHTDLRIPGLGGGLTLTRTWNSIWPASQSAMNNGIFGSNWRSTYEERVFVGSDGTIKYARSDGTFWSFLLYGSPAAYHVIAPANMQATLTEQGTTSWTITFQNGEQRIFTYNSGSLASIVDRNGNTTQLSYDASNRLITVTDPGAHVITFAYGSNPGVVTSVTTNFGVNLSYGYDSQKRLTSVTEPDQTTISLEYNSNSLITAVKDSQGKVLESHTYDSMGRGLTSSRANGVDLVTVTYPTTP